jgi:hypothetical protein
MLSASISPGREGRAVLASGLSRAMQHGLFLWLANHNLMIKE